MLLGFINVSSHEENSIPSSPQNRFGWKCCSFMAPSLSETLLKAVSKHSLGPSGKSLADKQTRRKGIWVFHFLWKTLYAIPLLGSSFCGGCRPEVAFFHSGRLPVRVDPASPSRLSSKAAFHFLLKGSKEQGFFTGHFHFQGKAGGEVLKCDFQRQNRFGQKMFLATPVKRILLCVDANHIRHL